MKIGIDASRAFSKIRTGTENYSYQLIRQIAKLDSNNQYVLYTRFLNCHSEERSDEESLNLFENKLAFAMSDLALSRDSSPCFAGIGMTNKKITIKNIPLPRLWTQAGLAKEMLFNPPDVLFVPAHTLPVIRRPGLKTVVTIHDLGYEYLPEYHQFPHKLYLNKSTEYAVWQSTKLIAVSEATKKDLVNKLGCPERKITVIYEGFDKDKFKENKSLKSPKLLRSLKINNPFILFVGTLQPRKNIERLIKAFSIMVHSSNCPLARRSLGEGGKLPKLPNLVIAGNKGWMYDGILSAPERFGVEEYVKFLGYASDDDLAILYNNCLLFCLPSLFEGFGLPVLEAMACGAPVLVSDSTSLPEVAGEAGLYTDPKNVDDMANKLEMMVNNETLRSKMSQKSLVQAQKFSWEKCGRETIQVLTND